MVVVVVVVVVVVGRVRNDAPDVGNKFCGRPSVVLFCVRLAVRCRPSETAGRYVTYRVCVINSID